MMEITVKVEDLVCTTKCTNCITADEAVDLFRGAMVGAGFHPDTIDKYVDTSSGKWRDEDES